MTNPIAYRAANTGLALGLCLAVFAIVSGILEKAHLTSPMLALAVTVVLAAGTWWAQGLRIRWVAALCGRLSSGRDATYLLVALVCGLALRGAWMLVGDVHLVGDASSYFEHAQELVTRQTFAFAQGEPEAHWPPGYPFLLYALFKLFGISTGMVIAANLLLFGITLAGVFLATRAIYNATAARIATLVILLWPNLLFLSTTGTKEAIVCALLPWVALLYHRAMQSRSARHALPLGLLMGMCVLTQPSLILLYGVLVLAYALAAGRWASKIVFALVVLVGMGAVIAPWSLRNHALYHRFVMVSVNGGDVFYRANNAAAKPGYNAPSDDSPLAGLDPVESDRRGYALATQWIKENPGDFARLALGKLVLYLGNDDTSLWQTFDDPANSQRGKPYYLLLMLANVYWMLIMLLLLVATWRSFKRSDSYWVLFAGIFICLLLIDALFEAGARHHVPLYGLMAIALGSLCANDDKRVASVT